MEESPASSRLRRVSKKKLQFKSVWFLRRILFRFLQRECKSSCFGSRNRSRHIGATGRKRITIITLFPHHQRELLALMTQLLKVKGGEKSLLASGRNIMFSFRVSDCLGTKQRKKWWWGNTSVITLSRNSWTVCLGIDMQVNNCMQIGRQGLLYCLYLYALKEGGFSKIPYCWIISWIPRK